MFQVEVVWNREFDFVPFGPSYETLDMAIVYAQIMENSGDGERVKKARVVNLETGKVAWAHGQRL